jgi:ABC-type multidrug transport system fused ATPase/permease subunit
MKRKTPQRRPERALGPLKRYWVWVALAPVLKLFEVACELATPFITKMIIDVGIANGDLGYVLTFGGVILGLAFAAFLITLVAQYLSARVAADYGFDLREAIYAQVGLISESQLDAYGRQKAFNLLNNDSFSMQSGVNMFMRLLLRPVFLLLGSFILSFLIDPIIGYVFLGVVVCSGAVIGLVMAVSPKKYARIQSDLDDISTVGGDSLKGARPIRAFNKEKEEQRKLGEKAEAYRKDSLSMGRYNALINPFTFCFINLGMILLVYLSGSRIEAGTLTTGEVVSAISYLTLALNALIMFSRMIVSLNRAWASKKRIDAFLSIKPSIVGGTLKADEADGGSPLIVFDGVSMSYGGGKPAVQGISFELKRGGSLGIIGGTGSGKSTIIALLERLYDPNEGKILYKGAPLKDYDLSSLRADISLVSQKPSIFKGTVRSNLLLGKADATDEECWAALKDSLAYEYVSAYEDGLDHRIEEGGSNLSGGQRQRLLIARALLRQSDLLILDDSTSALDYLSDMKVRKNIWAKEGLSKIIVSQRASTLRGCDEIIVLDEGKIVGEGSHESLLSSCPIYREIYEMQVRSE